MEEAKQKTKKRHIFSKRNIIIFIVLIFVSAVIIMGGAFEIFEQRLKNLADTQQNLQKSVKFTENGIESSDTNKSSKNQILETLNVQTAVVLNQQNRYNRIASVGQTAVQKISDQNCNLTNEILLAQQQLEAAQKMLVATAATSEKTYKSKAEELAAELDWLGEYIDDSKTQTKEEKLAYLMYAEIVTKYPYLESIAGDETKLNGTIKFYRYLTELEADEEANNSEQIQLTFIDEGSFNTKLDEYRTSGNKDVFKYFTLDEDENVLIAYGSKTTKTITTTDNEVTLDTINEISTETYAKVDDGVYTNETYTIDTKPIDYQSLAEPYVLPFNLLATLLVQTRNYDLVKDIADLAYNSEIVIGIYDNKSVTTNKDEYVYNKKIKYTENTELVFDNVSTDPQININSSKYSEVVKECFGKLDEARENSIHCSGIELNNLETATGNRTDGKVYEAYISEISSEGIVTGISSEAVEFKTTLDVYKVQNSAPTVDIVLADIWAGKWTSTYIAEEKNIPADSSENGLDDEELINIDANKLNADLLAETGEIGKNLAEHSKQLKEKAIEKIIEKTTFTVSAKAMTAADIRTHGRECTDCAAKLNAKYGKAWMFEQDTILMKKIEDKTLVNDVINEESLELVKQHVEQKLKTEAATQTQTRKDKFEKDITEQITYNQWPTAYKGNSSIKQTATYEKKTTTYQKDSSGMEEQGEKFSKILSQSKYQKTKDALLVRESWFWNSIREYEDTAKLENLLRYLFNVSYNTNAFGTFSDAEIEELFKIFEPKTTTNFSMVGGGLSRYLLQFGGSVTQYTFDGISYYKMYDDSAGNPTIGPGDIQWLSNHGRFSQTGIVRYGGESGTTYTDCNVEQKVNELLGPDGYKTKWNSEPSEDKAIYIDVETVDNVTDDMQSIYMDLVIEETSSLNLSNQQIYALTYIKYSTGNLTKICGGETSSITKSFVNVYNEALSKGYEANSTEFNKYIWENWWSIKWAGGYEAGRKYTGWLKGRDASFETFVKGTMYFDGGSVFSRSEYIYYSKEDILKIGFSSTSLQYNAARDASDTEKETEIFTYQVALGVYEAINDEYKFGIYTSSSGRTYIEWKQTTRNSYGQNQLYSDGLMGNSGCNVYGYAMLLNSVGVDITPQDSYDVYISRGYMDSEWTIETLLEKNNVKATLHSISGNDEEKFVSVLREGKGILIWVGPGYNKLYTSLYHWLVVADIRPTELGSTKGYDVYVVTSSSKGRGWQPIETIVDNNQDPGFLGYYLND